MSNLYKEFMEPCRMLDRKSVPDGLGGFNYEWTDGAEFDAAVVKDNTLAARVAEKQGVTEVFTVTVPMNVKMEFHDVFKRLSDGCTFRVTSNTKDSHTPKVASFQFGQFTAERWELPND